MCPLCAAELSSGAGPRSTKARAGAARPCAVLTNACSGKQPGRRLRSGQRGVCGGTVVETEGDTTLLESTWPGTDTVRDCFRHIPFGLDCLRECRLCSGHCGAGPRAQHHPNLRQATWRQPEIFLILSDRNKGRKLQESCFFKISS